MIDLTQLKALHQAARNAPWKTEGDDNDVTIWEYRQTGRRYLVAESVDSEDASLIAYLRNNAPEIIARLEAMEDAASLNTRTPPPTVWHRASEKLPTEADGDWEGCIWVFWVPGFTEPDRQRVSTVVREWNKAYEHLRGDFLWSITNFTKPKPPEV